MGDPSWEAISRPVLDFLREGDQSWIGLSLWQKDQKIGGTLLRQALAWLEYQGRVQSVYLLVKGARGHTRARLFWRAVREPLRDSDA